MHSQKQGIDMLVEQSKSLAFKSEQFTDVVERIPNEVAKQSDSLDEVKHALAAGAEAGIVSGHRVARECGGRNDSFTTQRRLRSTDVSGPHGIGYGRTAGTGAS